MIRIDPAQLDQIRDAARAGYPEEICGVLVGRANGATPRSIVRVVPVGNAREDERTRRYLISAEMLREIESAANRDGLDVIGFYHSHPDHPAVPSTFDREHSWPWYTYVIVSVERGDVTAARAWRLAEDRSTFQEEEILEGS
jgi:proteasome lid subunit RPN8/RPN11